MTQSLNKKSYGLLPLSEWDGFLLGKTISPIELLADLEAEFFGNPNDAQNVGLEMLGLYQRSKTSRTRSSRSMTTCRSMCEMLPTLALDPD